MKIDFKRIALLACALGVLSGCGTAAKKGMNQDTDLSLSKPKQQSNASHPKSEAASKAQGVASWYGKRFHGRRTSSGERFNMHALTAAHRTYPFGTRVLVRNLSNGKSVVVKVNDRGPHSKKRLIDVSYAAARELGMVGAGMARVEIEALAD